MDLFPFVTALGIGFLGSIHCLGMCGPIALVLPGQKSSPLRFLSGRLLYNAGRIATYGVFGAVAGAIGQSVALAGYQRSLGIIAGGLMILSVLIPGGTMSRLMSTGPAARVITWLKNRFGAMLRVDGLQAVFVIGLMNGALPCGLVYAALAASISTGSIPGSVAFMLAFGLATFPAMLGIAFAGQLIAVGIRRRLTRILPIGVAVMGALFILRGLSLGIPYLSPDMDRMLIRGRSTQTRPAPGHGDMRPAAAHADTSSPSCCE